MPVHYLEGKPVAEAVLKEVAERVETLKKRGIVPGLGTILVGDDPASAGYVRKKHEACSEHGFASFDRHIASDAPQADLLDAVREFNEDDRVHAFIIQYPVPREFDYSEAIEIMVPEKDADGLHPVNLGRLVLQEPGPVPATPAGIQAMLLHYEIPVKGREVVIVGRGSTLGRPLALLMTLKKEGANAAVTVVHTGVDNIASYTQRADIVIAAAGVPSIVTKEMVRPGAVVISGGITWEGKRLVPDVDESVAEVAGWITPRLGGVGPTTIAMLLKNTLECAERQTT
ncbi:MAG: bifunctional 5,10-methylenetetrahydrofolate dehydrogenase/5,10-methenyltetrahydrofolate cyclohydrolase [Deltaproteobacteria bacterium]|nr:bifunctional 5,10-methylenetetrahydrofolate dehydrogenase/5,10-methenyltetrahydrofolate cyclohydrolase [Deltaproteobacteria bacterium]